ncbi:MAG: HAMP domain-containing protein [Acidimicrobiia bacterium]|nr:HAMP domain-containing protein [Acidimicrobiia bacterium]
MSRRPKRHHRLATRLLVAYAITFLLLMVLVGFVGNQIARDALSGQLIDGLERQATSLSRLIPDDDVQEWVETVTADDKIRLTVVATDGDVVADSRADPAQMENHADRPEIFEALNDGVGDDTRDSDTTGFSQTYVAVPTSDGALRVSVAESALEATLTQFRTRMLLVMGISGLVGITAVALVTRYLSGPLRQLSDTATAIAAGDLDREPPMSSIVEVDQVGKALAAMKHELASRLDSVEAERRMLDDLFDALPLGTLLISGDDVVYSNSTLRDSIATVPQRLKDVTPHRIQSLVHEARINGVMVRSDLETGVPERILHVVATPVTGSGQVLVVVEDVTQKRRVDAMRRDFVANASHELKTPVASILASLDAVRIASTRSPERVEHFTDLIERSAQHLSRIVSDLLDLSRLESTDPEQDQVALDRIINEEANRARDAAGERGVVIDVEVEPIEVIGSEPDLRLAVRNLIDNAIRYTESGGSVSVTGGHGAGKVVISVADTGTGIAQRHLHRIFERFYRVDESRNAAIRGTGLGLAIVRHVVEAHGGRVEVDSELGVGSVFRMIL